MCLGLSRFQLMCSWPAELPSNHGRLYRALFITRFPGRGACSMHADDYAAVLKRKALQDIFAVEKLLTDSASPDEIIGFHAQQAVEKLFKAVLAARSIHFRRTHDLVELIDLIR